MDQQGMLILPRKRRSQVNPKPSLRFVDAFRGCAGGSLFRATAARRGAARLAATTTSHGLLRYRLAWLLLVLLSPCHRSSSASWPHSPSTAAAQPLLLHHLQVNSLSIVFHSFMSSSLIVRMPPQTKNQPEIVDSEASQIFDQSNSISRQIARSLFSC